MTLISFISDLHLKSFPPVSRKDDYCQSILDKLEYVLQNTDYLFILGDLFDAPVVDMSCTNRVNLLFKRYEREGKIIKILKGNHDMLGQNKGLLPTSLGSLLISNPKRNLENTVTIDNFDITPIIDFSNIPKVKNPSQINILVGHCLFEIPDDFTISREQIDEDFDYCILGHDHQPYLSEILNIKTKLFRIGSFSRKEATEINRERKVSYICFNTEDQMCNILPVPQEDNVFVEDFIKNEDVIEDLDLSELKASLHKKDKINLYTILKDVLNVDKDTIQLIQEIRTKNYNIEEILL